MLFFCVFKTFSKLIKFSTFSKNNHSISCKKTKKQKTKKKKEKKSSALPKHTNRVTRSAKATLSSFFVLSFIY